MAQIARIAARPLLVPVRRSVFFAFPFWQRTAILIKTNEGGALRFKKGCSSHFWGYVFCKSTGTLSLRLFSSYNSQRIADIRIDAN